MKSVESQLASIKRFTPTITPIYTVKVVIWTSITNQSKRYKVRVVFLYLKTSQPHFFLILYDNDYPQLGPKFYVTWWIRILVKVNSKQINVKTPDIFHSIYHY